MRLAGLVWAFGVCEGCLVPQMKRGGSDLVKHDQVVARACPGVTHVFKESLWRNNLASVRNKLVD
jgi:hypothetical protein